MPAVITRISLAVTQAEVAITRTSLAVTQAEVAITRTSQAAIRTQAAASLPTEEEAAADIPAVAEGVTGRFLHKLPSAAPVVLRKG